MLNKFTKVGVLLGSLVISLAFGLKGVWADEVVEDRLYAQPEPTSSTPRVIDDRLFKVVDALTDKAILPNGDSAVRLYPQPRLTYQENGTLKIRPDGWNLFSEISKSKVRGGTQGYTFAAPFAGTEEILVKAGDIEITHSDREGRLTPPHAGTFTQTRQGSASVSSIEGVYDGINVSFLDQGGSRQKFITINEKPDIVAEDTMILWEEYQLPAGARVFGNDDRPIVGVVEDTAGDLRVLTRSGESLVVSGAVIYDAQISSPEEIELHASSLKHTIIFDEINNTLKIGLKVSADYLLARERVYPVTIDPLYTICSGSCDTNQVYLRYMTSNNIKDGFSQNYLIVGYVLDAGQPAPRQTLIAFMQGTSNYFPNLAAAQGTLTSARLYMTRSDVTGSGPTSGGSTQTEVRQITTPWSKDSVIYGNPSGSTGIHGFLNAVSGSGATIPYSLATNEQVSWTITPLVQNWIAGQANYGLYVAPTPHWTSGNAPSWPQKIFQFRSTVSGSGGPFLQMDFTPPKPNLTDNGTGISPSTINLGQPFTATLKVRNASSQATTQSTVMRYYLNPSSNCTGLVNQVGTLTIPALAGNGTYTQVVNFTPTAAGSYCFQFRIDPDNVISEADEGDNNFYITSLTVNAAAKPDLTPNVFTISNAQKFFTNQQFSVNAVLRNVGTAAASNVQYSLMLRDGATGPIYDMQCGSSGAINVPANSANTYTFTCTLPSSLSKVNANYYVRLQADPANLISENDETNNSSQSTDTILVEQFDYNNGPNTPADPNGNTVPLDAKLATINGKAALAQTLQLQNKSTYKVQSQIKSDQTAKNYAADPVNTRTGAFEFSQTDFALQGLGLPIEFKRTYNSKYLDRNVRFGRGWSNSYHMFYYQNPSTQEVQIYLGGALASYFTPAGDGINFVAERGDFNTLYKEADYLVYKTMDGIKYRFSLKLYDSIGTLKEIEDTNGNKTLLAYVDVRGVDLLSTITDPTGRSIRFVYPTDNTAADWDKVKEIRESIGGTDRLVARYTYNANLDLTNVHYESTYGTEGVRNSDQAFTYDTDGKMTSYTDPRGVILYNEYDSSGRVLRQYEHNVRLDGSDVNVKRLVFELFYNDSADVGVPGSAHCATVKNYRTSSNQYFEKTCFNSDELKMYSEKGVNVEKWEYDSNGQSTKYTDANGNPHLYQYDAKRRLTQETLPNTEFWRTTIDYEYDNTYNRLLKKTQKVAPFSDPNTIVATKTDTYTIDSHGNVLTHQDPANATEKFEYNTNGTVNKYFDKRNNVTSYVYNNNGILTHEVRSAMRPDGLLLSIVQQFEYDNYGRKISLTDPRSKKTLYEYDTRGNVRKITDAEGQAKLYDYDTAGNRIKETDELGHVTDYQLDTDINASLRSVIKRSASGDITNSRDYDYVGNLTKEIDPLDRQVSLVYDTANRVVNKIDPRKTTFYEYNANGTLKRETDTEGTRTDYFYDERNNKVEERQFYSVNSHFTLKWEYDGFNRVTKYTDANNRSTVFEYDAMDRIVKKTDAAGGVTTYRYDANGNKTGERTPRAEVDASLRNSDGQSVTQVFDEINRVTKIINAENKETVYLYDQSNNLLKQTDWQNTGGTNATHVTVNEHDNVNRVTKTIFADGGSITYTYYGNGLVKTKMDQVGRITEYTYDDFNRLISEKDAGGKITSYTYDKAGNKKSVIYPDATQTSYDYNDLNKVEKVTDQLGATIQYVYDAFGNVIKETDKNNHVTSFGYDKLNRLTTETNAQNTATTYTYDGNNNRLTQTVAGKLTKFEYDVLNRVKKITYPGNKIESTTYDLNGNKASYTNGVGETVTYAYNALNQATSKAVAADKVVTYAYDNWGNLLNLTDDSGITVYGYNVVNQPTSETKTLKGLTGSTFAVSKTYYLDGTLKTLTDAGGKTITYLYNNRGQLATVQYGAQNLAAYLYNSFGKPSTVTYGNGVVTDYTYDGLNRTKKISTKNGAGAVLWSEDYGYDNQSNRVTMTDHTGRTVAYGYDALDQLTSAAYTIGGTVSTLSYAYDVAGNRTALNTPLGNTNYTYAAGTNELTSVTTNDLSIGVQFNGNGGVQRETYANYSGTLYQVDYSFTPENRLSGITYQSPAVAGITSATNNSLSFVYDDFGNRTAKIVNGSDTRYYLNQGLSVLNEINGQGAVTKLVVQGVGQVAEIDAAGIVTYIHQDVLGSTALLTDAAGTVVQEYDYDPFGAIIGSNGAAETNYLFTNQEFDQESELYYYNARYYNPALGRFITRDPILGHDGDPLSRNNYIYVKNNPLKFVDPDGLDPLNLISANGLKGIAGGVKMGAQETWNGAVNLLTHPIETVKNTGAAIGGMYMTAYDDAKYLYNRTADVGFSGLWQDTMYSFNELGNGWDNLSSVEKGQLIGYSSEKVAEIYLSVKGSNAANNSIALKIPQGLTECQFCEVSSLIKQGVAQKGYAIDDIVIQGSRANGTARALSDIDIGVRVPDSIFDSIANTKFLDSVKNAEVLQKGIIHSGPAGLGGLEKAVGRYLDMDTDLSIIRKSGPFDSGPFIPLK